MAKNSTEKQGPGRRTRAGEALEQARERTLSAYEAARGKTADAARDVSAQLAVYPFGAVLAGLAVGAVMGALVPRSRRETELLGTAGRRMTQAARDAAQKGIDAGRDQVDQATGKVVDKVGSALMEAVGGKE